MIRSMRDLLVKWLSSSFDHTVHIWILREYVDVSSLNLFMKYHLIIIAWSCYLVRKYVEFCTIHDLTSSLGHYIKHLVRTFFSLSFLLPYRPLLIFFFPFSLSLHMPDLLLGFGRDDARSALSHWPRRRSLHSAFGPNSAAPSQPLAVTARPAFGLWPRRRGTISTVGRAGTSSSRS